MESDWKQFMEATKNRKPNNYVVDAVRIFKLQDGDALDLGCGAGVDAKYLGEMGFRVTALDSSPDSIKVAREITSGLSVTVLEQRIEDFDFDNKTFDLIVAWRSLPFMEKSAAQKTLMKIQDHLKPDGICVFALFGPEDGWAKEQNNMSFFTVEELKNLWPFMKLVRLFEEKAEGNLTAGGTKFFHKIDGIAQKMKETS